MSYDLEIWSVKPVPLPESLPVVGNWTMRDGSAEYQGRGWQILIAPSQPVDIEDVPSEVTPLLAGVQHLTELTLEPIGAPQAARKLVHQVAKHIAKQAVGIVEDQQEGTLTTPAGVKRFAPRAIAKGEATDILSMSWWFRSAQVPDDEIGGWLTKYFIRHLPEALPRRYGLFEPPPLKYEDSSKEAFFAFLREHCYDMIIWYPHRPVLRVLFILSASIGWVAAFGRERLFKTNWLQMDFQSSVLADVGWARMLKRLWTDISVMLQPIYGDVRVLRGYSTARGTVWSGGFEAQEHPLRACWFAGIPGQMGQAAVVGPPYTDLWPELSRHTNSAGLALLSTDDWNDEEDVAVLVRGVPDDLRLVEMPRWIVDHRGWKGPNFEIVYPSSFPFRHSEQEEFK